MFYQAGKDTFNDNLTYANIYKLWIKAASFITESPFSTFITIDGYRDMPRGGLFHYNEGFGFPIVPLTD